jgi:hypothetical protein
MKKFTLLIAAFVMVFAFSACNNQRPLTADGKTEKDIKKEISKRAMKEARKQARKYKRDNWLVTPGSLPMEKALEKTWIMQYETDDKGNTKYITADGNGIAGNRTAAEMQAIETGKLQLAGLLETRMSALVSANIANTELSDQEAETITEVVENSKNIIANRIGFINPAFKMYRRLRNGNVEVSVKLFYNGEEADLMARKAVKDELREKLDSNEQDLRKLMGLDEKDEG